MTEPVLAVDTAVPARDALDDLCDALDPTREEVEDERERCYLDDEADAEVWRDAYEADEDDDPDRPWYCPQGETGYDDAWDWADGPPDEYMAEIAAEEAERRLPQVTIGHQAENAIPATAFKHRRVVLPPADWQAEQDEQDRYLTPVPAVAPRRSWWRRLLG